MCLDKRARTSTTGIIPGLIFVDPPEGWRYGFPKLVPVELYEKDIRPWLVEQGYPTSCLTDSEFSCRYFYAEPNE